MKLDINKMVSNFLGWKLPHNFFPDAGITFNPREPHDSPCWPIGTNLFTATQAKEMIEAILKDAVIEQPQQEQVRDWVEDFEHENGNYQCACIVCRNSFKGHKRRLVCKDCHDKRIVEALEAKCKCNMREKLVGDGCQVCNQQVVIDSLKDEVAELTAKLDKAREALKCIDEDLVNPVHYRLVKECLEELAK